MFCCCGAKKSAMNSGHVLSLYCRPCRVRDGPIWPTDRLSEASSGYFASAHPGVTFQNDLGNGRPCPAASVAGRPKASGKRSGHNRSAKPTCASSWIGRCISLTALLFELINVPQVHMEAMLKKRWVDPEVYIGMGSAAPLFSSLRSTSIPGELFVCNALTVKLADVQMLVRLESLSYGSHHW